MDWENERYIRVYTRDTVEWEMLPWQSRALWPNLLRKVDRAGYLPLGRHGARGLAALVKLPLEDVVEEGLRGLLEDGCVVLVEGEDGQTIFVPNFVPAQEAKKSARLRKEEQREREKLADAKGSRGVTDCRTGSRGVTHRDKMSQNVTDCHESGPNVTNGHGASHDVTPSLAEPSLAKMKPDTSNSAGAEPDPRAPPGDLGGPALKLVPLEPDPRPPKRFGPPELVAMWNELKHRNMPKAQKLTASRRRKIETRLRENPDPEWWREVIEAASASPHCRGESRPAPGASKPWRCTLDFLIENDTNAVKVIEGSYGDDRVKDPPTRRTPAGYKPFPEWT